MSEQISLASSSGPPPYTFYEITNNANEYVYVDYTKQKYWKGELADIRNKKKNKKGYKLWPAMYILGKENFEIVLIDQLPSDTPKDKADAHLEALIAERPNSIYNQLIEPSSVELLDKETILDSQNEYDIAYLHCCIFKVVNVRTDKQFIAAENDVFEADDCLYQHHRLAKGSKIYNENIDEFYNDLRILTTKDVKNEFAVMKIATFSAKNRLHFLQIENEYIGKCKQLENVYNNKYLEIIVGKIYCISNTINNLKYVGSTFRESIDKRFSEHLSAARTGHRARPIHRAMKELGSQHFSIRLLEVYPHKTKRELEKKEGEWIRKLNAVNNGYNEEVAGRDKKEYYDENADQINSGKRFMYNNDEEYKERVTERNDARRNTQEAKDAKADYDKKRREELGLDEITKQQIIEKRANGDFDCPFCGLPLANLTSLNRHKDSFHSAIEGKPHVCELCIDKDTSFRFERDLKSHINRVHKDDDWILCEVCNTKVKGQSSYIRHVRESKTHQKKLEKQNQK
jgi:16S rRNA C967 or C1407 C5-methylase (RsmB/RsmF family)